MLRNSSHVSYSCLRHFDQTQQLVWRLGVLIKLCPSDDRTSTYTLLLLKNDKTMLLTECYFKFCVSSEKCFGFMAFNINAEKFSVPMKTNKEGPSPISHTSEPYVK
jgi:hypothetical protein